MAEKGNIIIIGFLAVLIVQNYFNSQKLKKFMATQQERFDAIIGRLNTITSDIAADYQLLLDAVKNNTPISEESFAAAEANIAVLEQLGASVENPVPVPTP
jgi:hypothetical protein